MHAVVYDEETFPNCFTLSACTLGNPSDIFTWEISDRRNDVHALWAWLCYLRDNRIPMIGFNNLGFDYPILHDFLMSPGTATAASLYAKSQQIIQSQNSNRFANQIWERDRIIPQIDLFKIHHFDNKAKTQSLKGLQFNMRSHNVQTMPVEHGTFLTPAQMDEVIGYNRHDVAETDKFAGISRTNIEFRQSLLETMQGDVLNFNDTKIGERIFEDRLGEELTHTRVNGRRERRQTIRPYIRFADIIFPYIRFEHPEFQRIHQWMLQQVITETKGVFPDVQATVNGFTFHYGTGGIHGSVDRRVFTADDHYAIRDVDVAALYPNIGIQNKLFPAHLGEKFVAIYADIVAERKTHAKGTVQNAALKLAANGTYGKSNDAFSSMYDPQYTMAITVNGQLLLTMLAEWLMNVYSVRIIQINTDGITYQVARSQLDECQAVEKRWMELTKLELEDVHYKRMFIRDVNNYVAVPEKTGKPPKLKGAYVYYANAEEISNASPSAWYKDLSSPVIQRAAEAAMIHGIPPEHFIACWHDPFDFMLRAKATSGSQLFIGERPQQPMLRYYIAKNGEPLTIRRPATGKIGDFKRKNGIPDAFYYQVLNEVGPGVWDERIHTKNKSTYQERDMSFQAGFVVAECNVADRFDWRNLNREWYVAEAHKLILR